VEPLRLPRAVEDDPRAADLAHQLALRARPLWARGALDVPCVEVTSAFGTALKSAYSAGRIIRGLEDAQRALANELHGLEHGDRKAGVGRGGRVSRLLVLADDGSERFYRDVEALLHRHAPRILALRLSLGEVALGQLLFGRDQAARLLMVAHKDAVSAVLLALTGR
jgi:hypothetical protein